VADALARPADDPERPPGLAGVTGPWWSLASDFVLAPDPA
jgi:hypothetical protein